MMQIKKKKKIEINLKLNLTTGIYGIQGVSMPVQSYEGNKFNCEDL